jgi:predicted negative regulator of RcsB-dependent stress response
MSQVPPAHPADPSAQPAAPVYVSSFETAVRSFWEKNRQGVFILVGVILLAIVGREVWQFIAASRERGVQEEYAKVAAQPAGLEAFANANSGHPLAGVAWLRLADGRYTTGDYKAAATLYQKASGSLKNPALLGRAKLGAAISQINAGDQAAGEAALKAVVADATLARLVRAEAGYHLASLAADAGRTDDVRKLAEEVSKIDPMSTWAQRASLLVVSAPAAAPAAAPADTGLSFKTPGK